jgi:hypothetical protein
MDMKVLHEKQCFNACCVLAIAATYILSGPSSTLAFPSGGYTTGSGMSIPLELFDIAADADSSTDRHFNFPNLTKYAGFVGAHRDTFKNSVSQWVFPERPEELQWRPLFFAMDANVSKSQFESGRGIRFGYMVDGNIIARNNATIYCDRPSIKADGVSVNPGFYGGTLVGNRRRKKIHIEAFFSTVPLENAHLITSSKVVEYTTCGVSYSGPKRIARLTAREHQQFKRLVGYLADVTGNPYLQAAASGKSVAPVK